MANQPKIIDVAKAGSSGASPTSRPIINSGESQTDPMVNSQPRASVVYNHDSSKMAEILANLPADLQHGLEVIHVNSRSKSKVQTLNKVLIGLVLVFTILDLLLGLNYIHFHL